MDEKTIRQRAQNAERQRRYRERHLRALLRREKKRTISAVLLVEIDENLQVLCVHHGCDRRTMLEMLIGVAYDEMRDSMRPEELRALQAETFDGRTRKHRVPVTA